MNSRYNLIYLYRNEIKNMGYMDYIAGTLCSYNINNKELIFIESTPGLGKSTLGLKIIKYFLFNNKNVLYFNFETGKKTLIKRLKEFDKNIKIENLEIIDKANLECEKVKLIIDNKNKEKKIDLILIDYLELINFNEKSKEDRYKKIEKFGKDLKNIANTFSIPVVLISEKSGTGSVVNNCFSFSSFNKVKKFIDKNIIIEKERIDFSSENKEEIWLDKEPISSYENKMRVAYFKEYLNTLMKVKSKMDILQDNSINEVDKENNFK